MFAKVFKSRPPMHDAAANADLQRVQVLVQKGEKIDVQDKDGSTALHVASSGGFTAIVSELLDRQANTTIQNLAGYTALHTAAENGHAAVVQLLLGHRNKASSTVKENLINARDAVGRTAVALALERGHHEVAKVLINSRADICIRDTAGRTPFMAAAERGDVASLVLLRPLYVSIDEPRNVQGGTPLHAAAAAHQATTALWLANNGASLTTMDNQARTPLDVAQKLGDSMLYRELRDLGLKRLPESTAMGIGSAQSEAAFHRRSSQGSGLSMASLQGQGAGWGDPARLSSGGAGGMTGSAPTAPVGPASAMSEHLQKAAAFVPTASAYPALPPGAPVLY